MDQPITTSVQKAVTEFHPPADVRPRQSGAWQVGQQFGVLAPFGVLVGGYAQRHGWVDPSKPEEVAAMSAFVVAFGTFFFSRLRDWRWRRGQRAAVSAVTQAPT